ncbi:MAG TPA: amino acid permease [Streptosporangiaceae bacterium]
MATAADFPVSDSVDLADLGYRQELHRSLGAFASFAAGFSFVSILTTVFQLFAFGFAFGGPAFVWTWPIVFCGQFSVALVFAELSSRYPISGSIYQWSRRISTEFLGWFAGWFMMIGYIVSVSAIAIALQVVLPSVWTGFQLIHGSSALTSSSGAANAIVIGSIVIIVSTVIGNIGVGIMSRITRIGVSCEIVGVVLLIALFFSHAKRGPSAALLHTNGVAGHGSYLWPFLISALMACYVMYGFDSAGELSEETNNPRVTAPRGILRAMLVSGVGGALLLVGALLAAPSLLAPQLGTEGLAYVISSRLGTGLGKVLLVDVAIAILSAALAIQASASRVMFSMARDGRLPFSRRLAHVSDKRGTPAAPNIVVGLLAIALLVVNLGQAALFTDITGVAVVVVYLAYLGVTVPRLVDRLRPGFAGRERQATDTTQFSLGRLGLPVNIIAVLFGGFFLIDIGWPRAVVYGQSWYLQYFSPIFAAGCAIVGIACYIRIKRREGTALAAELASAAPAATATGDIPAV